MGGDILLDRPVDIGEMGRRMETARAATGMTVSQLSFRAEVNETLLRKYLAGKTEPGSSRLGRIARALNVNADWLLQNTENPNPVPDVWDGETERRANPPAAGGAPLEAMDVPPRKRPSRRRSA